MTPLRQALADYLRVRRRLGFKLKVDQRLLENFVAFLEAAGAERITTELALMWARLPDDAHPHRWRQRLGIVRGFARYVATLDPSSEVPSKDLLPARRPRVAPYIYSPAEISALMDAAGSLTPPLRAAAFRTRDRTDGHDRTAARRGARARPLTTSISPTARCTSAPGEHKQREVPLHPTATRALRDYARLTGSSLARAARRRRSSSARAAHGSARTSSTRTFAKLIAQVGLEGAGERARPTPARSQALCGRRGYAPCLSVFAGNGAVGDALVRITWRVGVTARVSQAS